MKYKDLQGQIFGKLTVLYKLHNYHKQGTYWLCVCKCGNLKEVRRQDLKRGYVKSCGCSRSGYRVKHTRQQSKLYRLWSGIKSRCYNEKCENYKDYGARGIKMCNEWLNNINKPLSKWCEILNLNYCTVYKRIYNYNWSIEKALSHGRSK